MGVINSIATAAGGGDDLPTQILQMILKAQQGGAMTPETPAVAAPVPGAGPSAPVPAGVVTPTQDNVSGKKGGIMGALGRIFTPEAGTFWDSAWKNGLMGAKSGQAAYQQELADNATKLKILQQNAAAGQARAGADLLGSFYKPTGNGGIFDMLGGKMIPGLGGKTTPTSEQERLFQMWDEEEDPKKKAILRSMLRGAPRPSSGGRRNSGTVNKPPAGFVLE